MNTKITVSMAAAVVVAISMAFAPASADQREESAAASAAGVVMASAETPQEAVWDMTYGAEKPMAIVEVAEPFAEANPVTDLSMG